MITTCTLGDIVPLHIAHKRRQMHNVVAQVLNPPQEALRREQVRRNRDAAHRIGGRWPNERLQEVQELDERTLHAQKRNPTLQQ